MHSIPEQLTLACRYNDIFFNDVWCQYWEDPAVAFVKIEKLFHLCSLCLYLQDSLAQAVADEKRKEYMKELGPKPVPLTVPGEAITEEDVSFTSDTYTAPS